jgi:hypothetical protein
MTITNNEQAIGGHFIGEQKGKGLISALLAENRGMKEG